MREHLHVRPEKFATAAFARCKVELRLVFRLTSMPSVASAVVWPKRSSARARVLTMSTTPLDARLQSALKPTHGVRFRSIHSHRSFSRACRRSRARGLARLISSRDCAQSRNSNTIVHSIRHSEIAGLGTTKTRARPTSGCSSDAPFDKVVRVGSPEGSRRHARSAGFR